MSGLIMKVAKADRAERLVFGWAMVAVMEDGKTLRDRQGDEIEISELEKAAYQYVIHSREGGEMHRRGGVAELVESAVFSREKIIAMGIPEGLMPEGWWIGMHITDENVWEKIVEGAYTMFSIEGVAERVPIGE